MNTHSWLHLEGRQRSLCVAAQSWRGSVISRDTDAETLWPFFTAMSPLFSITIHLEWSHWSLLIVVLKNTPSLGRNFKPVERQMGCLSENSQELQQVHVGESSLWDGCKSCVHHRPVQTETTEVIRCVLSMTRWKNTKPLNRMCVLLWFMLLCLTLHFRMSSHHLSEPGHNFCLYVYPVLKWGHQELSWFPLTVWTINPQVMEVNLKMEWTVLF